MNVLESLPKPVALVLGGGASLGGVQVGQLRALVERAFVPEMIVGTSVGALNGAFMAKGMTKTRVDELAHIWHEIEFDDLFPGIGMGTVARSITPGREPRLASDSGLRALFERHVPQTHAELEIPFAAVATEVRSGDAVVLSEGDLRKHLLASASVPFLLPSQEVNGARLVDGGLAANIPLLAAERLGASSAVILDAGHTSAPESYPSSELATGLHLSVCSTRPQAHGVWEYVCRTDFCTLFVPPPPAIDVFPDDFSEALKLANAAYASTRELLDELSWTGPGQYGGPRPRGRSDSSPD